MMRWTFAALTLLAAPLAAEPVYVRAGEHGDFTRVVLNSVPGRDFDIRQNGRQVELEIKSGDADYRLDRVFNIITRDRLQDISSDGQRLLLTLGCNCEARAEYQSPNLIVLEISESPDPDFAEVADEPNQSELPVTFSQLGLAGESPSPFPLAFPTGTTPGNEIAALESDNSDPAPVDRMPSSTSDIPTEEKKRTESLPLITERVGTAAVQMLAPSIDNSQNGLENIERPDSRLTGELNDLQERLAEQIGLAATQGVLTANSDQPSAFDEESIFEKEGTESSDHLEPLFRYSDSAGNMAMHSSVRRTGDEMSGGGLTSSGLACLDPAVFDVAAWVTQESFDQEISQHRESLYGEFDKLNKNAQLSLAKAYAHYGFGAEALQVLRMDEGETVDEAAAFAVASLLENGPGPATGDLAAYAECDDDSALWSILAIEEPQTDMTVNAKAAIRALNKLPRYLREMVAPELSNRFRALGDVGSAATAMRTLSRTKEAPTPAEQLETAEVDLARGDDSTVDEQLEEVVETGALEAPLALIRLIDLKVANNQRVSSDLAVLASSYVHEFSGTEIAADLVRVQINAQAQSGDFSGAFASLEEADASGMDTAELVGNLYRIVQEKAPDVVFLQQSLNVPAEHGMHLPARTRLSFAERLVGLGFADEAEEMIRDIPPSIAPREQQLVRGQIHLAQGHTRQALAVSESFSGEEFARLKADALYAEGDFGAAEEAYLDLGDEEAALRASIRSGDRLPEILGVDDATARDEAADENSGPLAAANSLVSQSSSLAEEVTRMLAAPEYQVEQGL